MGLSPLTKQLASTLAPSFKKAGFVKAGPTWRRSLKDLIQVFNIQKSQWGDQFYLNIGIYLRQLGDDIAPPEYRCHVRCRAERLLPSDVLGDLTALLDFDKAMSDVHRRERLGGLINEHVLPWFGRTQTTSQVMVMLSSGDIHKHLVNGYVVGKEVRAWLGGVTV